MFRERRSTNRLRLAFTVLVEGPFGIRRCVARDVSARGLFIETLEPHAPGTELRVTFSLPDDSWEMTLRCTVRHVLRLAAGDGILHGMGLSFEEVEEDLADGITAARRMHA